MKKTIGEIPLKNKGSVIRFHWYAPLTVTAKDKMSKKEFAKVKKQLDKMPSIRLNKNTKIFARKMGEAAGATMDFYARSLLEGIKQPLAYDFINRKLKITRWDRIRWRIRDIVSGVRVAIAEWIGGDDLHSNCGDY